MSEYQKIETVYERDEMTHKLKPELTLKNRTYSLLKLWEWTQKIDGTNIRLIWKDGVFTIGGRTDNAQLDAQLWQRLQREVSVEKLAEIFPGGDAVIYGEGYGAGIQKGGKYRPDKAFIMFDVLVEGTWWLNWEGVCDVAQRLGLDTVPYFGCMSLEEATQLVRAGIPSRIGSGLAEGLVGRPQETLFDKKGARLIVKLKTKDF